MRRVLVAMPAQAHDLKSSCASLGLAWRIVSTYELPGGALVWLHLAPHAEELGGPALARELVIAETGVVARLRVKNPTAHDVLLPSDVVLDGGKQTRVVERSVILAASSEVDIPVRCVEAGRWEPRDARTAQSFELSASVSSGTREHLAQLKQRSLRERKHYDLDQNAIWTHVESELAREHLTSATSSYSAVLVKRQRRAEQAKALDVRAPRGANAVAVIRAAGASWVEAFPSHAHVEASIAALVADLLDPPADAGPGAGASKRAARKPSTPLARAASALSMIWAADVIGVTTPAGTMGRAFAIDGEGVAGCVLVHDARLAHLAVSVTLRA